MDAVALHEDVRSHSGIPFSLEVAEVGAGSEELLKCGCCHLWFDWFCLRSVKLQSGGRERVHPGDLDTKHTHRGESRKPRRGVRIPGRYRGKNTGSGRKSHKADPPLSRVDNRLLPKASVNAAGRADKQVINASRTGSACGPWADRVSYARRCGRRGS